MALMVFRPPKLSAGKNLATLMPMRIALSTCTHAWGHIQNSSSVSHEVGRSTRPTQSLGRAQPHGRMPHVCTSVGVMVPGNTGTLWSRQNWTTSSFRPGQTMKSAPALMACTACSMERTVPAPSRKPSSLAATMFLIDCSAAGVLNVISAHGIPPCSQGRVRHAGQGRAR